jgi:hypothetical protein
MRALPLVLPVVLVAACAATEPFDSGAGEPIRVQGGTFVEGRLPVRPDAETPKVVYASGVGGVVTAGQGDIAYNGLATKDAFAVGVAFPTVGSGYWTVPVDGPDVTQDGQLLFDLVLDFTPEVPYGLQTLDFVAFDGDEEPGPAYHAELCVLPEVAGGNFAACDPETTPQNAILSLSWDTEVDLDLVIVAPNGKLVTSKHPTTALATLTVPREALDDPSTGTLSRDSNADCAIDGINVESLVFPGEPPPGEYEVWVRLHQHCGHAYVNWKLELLRRVDAADGTHPVETTHIASGELLASQVSRGDALGTFVTTVTLP